MSGKKTEFHEPSSNVFRQIQTIQHTRFVDP